MNASRRTEPPVVHAAREAVHEADKIMADVAPQVARAYERQRGSWAQPAEMIDDVWRAFAEDADDLAQATRVAQEEPTVTPDRVGPSRTVEGADTPIETVEANLEADAKAIEEAIEAYRASVAQVLSEEADGTVTVQGVEHKFNLDDKIYLPVEEGTGGREVTVREMLEENRAAENELQAVSVCSIRPTS